MIILYKGQSAIEYLTTYGWMLLVIAIVGGAIFTTVQNSSQIQSTSGLANADVQIENFGVTNNGLETELRAASADQIENVNISLIDQDTGETVYSDTRATMPVGDTETVTFSDVGSSENTNTYDVEITYDAGSLDNLTAEGTITGRISINGTIPETTSDPTGSNGSGDETTSVNAPTARFSAPSSVHPGQSFTVDASGSTDNGSISSYRWDWENDESTDANGETATNSYGSTGAYTINLTVSDDQNNNGSTTTEVSVVSNSAPLASFSTNFTDNVSTGETFQLDASASSDGDGSINSYQWDWTNDGTIDATGQTATHSYTSSGTYTAELTITDDDGTTNTTTKNIEVTSSTTGYTTDSFESYSDGESISNPYNNPNSNMIADNSRAYNGSISVHLEGDGYGGYKTVPDVQPESVSYVYYETGSAADHAWAIFNSNDQQIAAAGSNNPDVKVAHGGGTTTLISTPSPGYGEWRRITFTFDWQNDEFDVLWEDLTGSSDDQSLTNLAMSNSAESIGKWDFEPQSWNDPSLGSKGEVWVDEIWGINRN